MTIHMATRPEYPNFDYLRLLAAFAVLLHHSFTLGQPGDAYDPVILLTGQSDFPSGTYAVCVFLMISGFLVTRSARETPLLPAFLAGRLLRVVPGLFICQLMTALFIGMLFSTLGAWDFVKSRHWLHYAISYTIDPGMTWEVPTVIFYPSPDLLGHSFNASLWSLQQELVCYAIVAILLVVRMVRWVPMAILLFLTLPFFVPWSRDHVDVLMDLVGWRFEQQRLSEFLWVASAFFTGALIYFLWRRQDAFPRWPLLVCLAAFILACWTKRYYDLFPLYATYPLLMFCVSTRFKLPSLKRLGDLSYGIYLYGWPYQQLVRAWIGPEVRWWQVFLLAGTAAAVTAYASWHIVERPALALKRHFRRTKAVPAG